MKVDRHVEYIKAFICIIYDQRFHVRFVNAVAAECCLANRREDFRIMYRRAPDSLGIFDDFTQRKYLLFERFVQFSIYRMCKIQLCNCPDPNGLF